MSPYMAEETLQIRSSSEPYYALSCIIMTSIFTSGRGKEEREAEEDVIIEEEVRVTECENATHSY